MIRRIATAGTTDRRTWALVGLAGAAMSGIGDVLILGRSASGRDFDQAVGRVPASVRADPRWRSMWNGAGFPPGRVHAGAAIGHVGIGLLQWLALRGIGRSATAGRAGTVASAAAAAFAVSGVATHQCCASVILAYRQALQDDPGAAGEIRPSPRSVTPLLAVSAAGTLGALAAFSGSLVVGALQRRRPAPDWRSLITPLPAVLATLGTFGRLPAPIGGYLRPASISVGLITYFALTAASRRGAGEPSADG